MDIVSFLRDTMEHHKRLFEDRQCLIQLKFDSHPRVSLDVRAIRMVFNNLIVNALRYSPTGSSLTIHVRKDEKFCNIDFVDLGFGFDKIELKRVFKKFYRVQNQETQNIEGAGLGLYISKQIVKSHKGKINAFSEGRGKGTCFIVSLPLNSSPSKKSEEISEEVN